MQIILHFWLFASSNYKNKFTLKYFRVCRFELLKKFILNCYTIEMMNAQNDIFVVIIRTFCKPRNTKEVCLSAFHIRSYYSVSYHALHCVTLHCTEWYQLSTFIVYNCWACSVSLCLRVCLFKALAGNF